MEWWNEFWTYIEGLQEGPKGYLLGTAVALLSVLVGSLFALFGVASTNKTNQKNLASQLEHDQLMRAKEHTHDQAMRAKEHELSLRKQIYLDAAEAIALGLSSITATQNLNKSPLEIREAYSQRATGMARLHVVASEDVALKFANLYREIDATFMTLRVERMELDGLHTEMQRLASTRDHYRKSNGKLGDLIHEAHLAGTMTKERFAVLSEVFERESRLAEKHHVSHEALAQILGPMQFEFTRRCFAEHKRLAMLTLPLIAAVRRDMNVPINEATYIDVLRPNEINLKQLRTLFRLPEESPSQG